MDCFVFQTDTNRYKSIPTDIYLRTIIGARCDFWRLWALFCALVCSFSIVAIFDHFFGS
jgi:hypothetical protein